MKKMFKKKSFTPILLAISLLLTGSYAWRDINQHKTNQFSTEVAHHNVTLVENFSEVTQWGIDQQITKSVAVRNGDKADDNALIYDDAYVRIQFREFMEISEQKYIYSDHRYMVDEKGDIMKFTSSSQAVGYLQSIKHSCTSSGSSCMNILETIKTAFDAQEYVYIRTDAHDPNGQYGKFLVMDVEYLNPVSLVEGQTNQSNSAQSDSQHDALPENNNEHNYTIKTWTDTDRVFDEYVAWQLGSQVITVDEWIQDGLQPVSKWIIDTHSEEGWVYWGQPLEHSTTATVPTTMTSNFLESVSLVKQPNGKANYDINVYLDAVSYEDLDLWTDANQDILGMLKGSNDDTETIEFDLQGKTVGDTITFADQSFIILYIDQTTKAALIMTKDVVSMEVLNSMEILAVNGNEKFPYSHATNTSEPAIYNDSYLKIVDQAFYDKIIKNHTDHESVLPVSWDVEVPMTGNADCYKRTDAPTLVDKKGEKTAFSLSMSDVNAYGLSEELLVKSSRYWLRSPSFFVNFAGTIESNGTIWREHFSDLKTAFAPALWIQTK
ncbi:hypothetical protein AOC36_07985 [Erysipelothrix larvae]|uniref:MucBP domain-containing protein n=1 Tax=Erysipelothrix larvae TaxID=1514105 RepID=A0A0X8H0P9_9FIRM|nr:hypothetical protein [Erysipelothrix larvae]AMC93926.1 hypothetical protein AOC36_07985 [Erysipelothrix larvae]